MKDLTTPNAFLLLGAGFLLLAFILALIPVSKEIRQQIQDRRELKKITDRVTKDNENGG